MPNNKYNQLKRQYSIDGGLTWHDLLPMVYKVGNVIETNSDCTDSDGCRWVVLPITEAYDCDSNYNMYQVEAEECLNQYGVFVRSGNIRRYRLIEDYSIACGYSGPICTPTSITSSTYDIVYNGGAVEWNEVATPVVYKITTITDIDKGCNETSSSSNREEITDYTISYSPSGDNTTEEDRTVTATVKYEGETIGSFSYLQKMKVINADLEFTFSSDSVEYMLNGDYYTANTSPYSNTLSNLGIEYLTNCYGTFMESSITELIKFPDVDQVDVMDSMFESCTELTSLDLSNWKTDSLTSMNNMFFNCTALTSLNISSFNTSNVTEMGGLFSDCHSLTSLDVSNFDTSNNTIFDAMFSYCESLSSLDLSSFNTSNATSFGGMFEGCTSLQSLDLSMFDTSNVESYGFMFKDCTSLQSLDLSNWKYKKDDMFDSVTANMFQNCNHLISIVLNNVDCDTYNFIKDEVEIAGLSSKVVITTTAENCGDDNTNTETECGDELEFVWRAYNSSKYMFILNSNIYYIDNNDCVKNDDGTYTYHTTLTELGIDKLISCADAFSEGNPNYGELVGIKKFPCTKNVYKMDRMFYDCQSLRYIDGISRWDTSNLWSMSNMFGYCSSLDGYIIDLSRWNISKLTNNNVLNIGTDHPFWHCKATINISNWDLVYLSNTSFLTFYEGGVIIANNISVGSLGVLKEMLCNGLSTSKIITNTKELPQKDATLSFISLEPQAYIKYNCDNKTIDYTTHNDDGTYTYNTTLTELGIDNLYFSNNLFGNEITLSCPTKIISLPFNENTYSVYNMIQEYCGHDVSIDLSLFNSAPNIECLHSCFKYSIVTNEDKLNISKMKTLESMFNGNGNETLNVSNWDTSKIINMNSVFSSCIHLTSLDLSNWDTSNAVDMSGMFFHCYSLTSLDLSNFDTSNVICMSGMFYDCSSLTSLDLSSFDTSNAVDMSGMFYYCSGLTSLDVSNFDVSNVYNMSGMFSNCRNLTSLDLSMWDISNLTHTTGMFMGCNSLTSVNLTGWDVSKLIGHSDGMFGINENLKIIIGDVSIEEFNKWANFLDSLGLPSSMLEVTLHEEYKLSFEFEGSILYYSLNNKRITANTNPYSTYLFYDVLVGDKYLYNCKNAFANTKITKLTQFPDTSNVTNMSGMFSGCTNLTSLDVSSFNTSNVTDMNGMFYNCSSLTSLDLSNFDTSNVTNMYGMFSGCTNLTSLDVSNFVISNVTSAYNMFDNCNKLTTIYAYGCNEYTITKLNNTKPENCTLVY